MNLKITNRKLPRKQYKKKKTNKVKMLERTVVKKIVKFFFNLAGF